jgi:hypothetical protein
MIPTLPRQEQTIVDSLLGHLPRAWHSAFAYTEIPSYGRARTDVVVQLSRTLVAIEVKRTAWSRALVQALLNRHLYDQSYIALWHSQVHQRVLVNAARWGIGVISVSESASRIVQPAVRGNPDPESRRRLLSLLETRREAQIEVVAA